MEFSHYYDKSAEILWVTVAGVLNADEIEAFVKELANSPDHPVNVDTIWDLDDYDFTEAGRSLFERLIANRKTIPGRRYARIALVVSSDFGFGMCRMYQIMSELAESVSENHLYVARSSQEAVGWHFAARDNHASATRREARRVASRHS